MVIDARHSFAPRDGRGHVDAERLAEYVENRLPTDVRRDVQRHLADCDDCRAILADVSAFTAEMSTLPLSMPRLAAPFLGRRRVIMSALGVAAAAAGVIAFSLVRVLNHPARSSAVSELVAVVSDEPARPFEGRLSLGFGHRPPPDVTRGPFESNLSPDVRIAAAALEKLAAGRKTPEGYADVGVASAISGNLDRAVAALEQATALEPDNPSYLNDLSAVYLARADRQRNAADLFKALAAADRALVIAARLPAACFNRALALERLARRDESRRMWATCLEGEPASAWSDEIRQHIGRLASR